ncbi:hypothetical protein C8C77_12412 [Halanaerobium saccharolyticum]|jgi:putative membrane protein|uniref:Uncharacterized protein n=1 Tax=Halanaerobium saccharolyticum TaxID=43595 RepID=A0A4R6SGT6_9FIRM|nr:hypothetical protein [Halanaerobium saccharolyticum]TDQ00138.1 hypothetical protein C7957_104139 [Halanaerobium saccharolyticum]TDW00897.1 hypothetical protein C8C77_12412 [Halanaerobium saccharolyticum]TDX52537.1 hypothetical protein C7956_12312 [Halanaerobium saccharolyticum]
MMGGGFSIIFWIVIIGVVYYFFREYNRKNNHIHDGKREVDHRIVEDNPEELARKRYAKGENYEQLWN